MVKKILLAPDSYKGTMSAQKVCEIMELAIKSILPDVSVIKMPVSDGGEGLVSAFMSVSTGKYHNILVNDPLNRKIKAEYAILDDGTAIIEMASASGLPLLKKGERNPLLTSSKGVGELIIDALNQGCSKILLGLGGSSTNDGGMGAAHALGFRFRGKDNLYINNLNGQGLGEIENIDISGVDPRLNDVDIKIACDVTNPLHGQNGSAYIFAPQKGATASDVEILDRNLKNYAKVIKKQFNLDPQQIAGTGAAGGLAIPFLLLKRTKIESGLDIILEHLNFRETARDCDIVITGEGKTDHQSAMGKVLSGVAKIAAEEKIPVIALSGGLNEGYDALYNVGMSALFSTCRQIMTLDEALSTAQESLYSATIDLFRLIKAIS